MIAQRRVLSIGLAAACWAGGFGSLGIEATQAPALAQYKGFPTFPSNSAWNFTRTLPNGVTQPGAFRVVNGRIYHLDTRNPVGRLYQDGDGRVYMEFLGHRLIARGSAVVEKIENGYWGGLLSMGDAEFLFEMRRR